MSLQSTTAQAQTQSQSQGPNPSISLPPVNRALRLRQLRAIFGVEFRQRFIGLRMVPAILLALGPAALLFMVAMIMIIFPEETAQPTVEQSVKVYAEIYYALILRFCIFFGSAAIFLSLFRADVMNKNLHYAFLTPARRELLVLGKYLAGIASAILVFGFGTALAWFMIYLPSPAGSFGAHFLAGPGAMLLAKYLGITVLACLGYGAVFLAIGQFFGNPIIPTVFALVWEGINLLLPPMLAKLSVIHYLGSLTPVPVETPLISLVSEPTPAPVAIVGLLVFTAVVLGVAMFKVRDMEIDYGGE